MTDPAGLEDVVVSLNAQGEVIHIDLRDKRYSDFRVPFTRDEVEHGLDDYAPDRAASDPLVLFGATLFGTVFAGERGQALWDLLDQVTRANRALRLRIRTNLERTQHLPWELMYDASRGDFVALSGRVALVRTRPDDFHVPKDLPPLTTLRVLLVTADAGSHSGAEADAAAFGQALAEAGGAGRVQVQRLAQPTPAQLRQRLEGGRFDAFVFMGGGVLQQELSKAGGLRQALQLVPAGPDDDGLLARNRLGQWLREAGVRLAVLVGDHGDWIARSFAKQVPATLGCRGEVRPETRQVLAATLGRLLPTGLPLDLAVTTLRQAVDRALPGTGEWCRLIFYLQSAHGGILLGPGTAVAAAVPPPPAAPAAARPSPPAVEAPPEAEAPMPAGAEPHAGTAAEAPAPAPEVAPVQQLARAGLGITAGVRLLDAIDSRLAALAPAPGLPLDDAHALADSLRGLLAEAERQLADLAQAAQPSALAALEAALADPAWDDARTRLPQLDAALAAQQQAMRDALTVLQQGEVQVKLLEPPVDGARMAGAPFGALEAALYAAHSRLAALKSALEARLLAELPGLARGAQDALAALDGAVAAARPQIEKVKPLVRQADLLIVQTPQATPADGTVDGAWEYRVVLRCAERTADYGIPIVQDVRSISRTDRDWLVAQLRDFRGMAYRQIGPRPSTGTRPTPAARRLRRVGVFLRRMVIPDGIAEVLRRERWSFNIATNDLELPWELLCFGDDEGEADPEDTHDSTPAPATQAPQDVFCLGQAVSRLPLGEAFPRSAPRRPSASRRRRMLLVHADPAGTLTAAAGEVAAIAAALGPLVEVRHLGPEQATVAALNEALIDSAWDLIHFTGHADFDADDPARSALVLQGGRFEAGKIARLARGRPLVFLNACASAASGAVPDDPAALGLLGDTAQVAGLASAFLYSGALACVGALWPVVDPSAATLAVAFYRQVLAGDPLGEALRVARTACWQAEPEGSTWAGYVLYGDPTRRLTEA